MSYGHSVFIEPWGVVACELGEGEGEGEPEIETAEIDHEFLWNV